MSYRAVESAEVSPEATIGDNSSIWHLSQVREQAVLGENCIVGRGAYIGTGVRMGDNCKVQNHALVYEPAVLGHGVFIGPAVVLTNDTYPRAVNPDGSLKSASDWEAVGVTIDDGAAIGARSVCVAPVRVGAWALVAAGSVVTRDVPELTATQVRPSTSWSPNSCSKAATCGPWATWPEASTASTAARSSSPMIGLAGGMNARSIRTPFLSVVRR